MATGETITITEAALRLNVSERTVYRMLKTGRLTRIYDYDSVRLMSDEVEKLGLKRGSSGNDTVSNMSVIVGESLHEQIAAKDAQISQLLARQEEMSRMLERLQQQLYELTRFVLSQAQTPPRRGFLASFLRRDRRASNEPSGDKT